MKHALAFFFRDERVFSHWQWHGPVASLALVPIMMGLAWLVAGINGTSGHFLVAQIFMGGMAATAYHRVVSFTPYRQQGRVLHALVKGLWFGLWLNVVLITFWDGSFWTRMAFGGGAFALFVYSVFDADTPDAGKFFRPLSANGVWAGYWLLIIAGLAAMGEIVRLHGAWLTWLMLVLLNVIPYRRQLYDGAHSDLFQVILLGIAALCAFGAMANLP